MEAEWRREASAEHISAKRANEIATRWFRWMKTAKTFDMGGETSELFAKVRLADGSEEQRRARINARVEHHTQEALRLSGVAAAPASRDVLHAVMLRATEQAYAHQDIRIAVDDFVGPLVAEYQTMPLLEDSDTAKPRTADGVSFHDLYDAWKLVAHATPRHGADGCHQHPRSGCWTVPSRADRRHRWRTGRRFQQLQLTDAPIASDDLQPGDGLAPVHLRHRECRNFRRRTCAMTIQAPEFRPRATGEGQLVALERFQSRAAPVHRPDPVAPLAAPGLRPRGLTNVDQLVGSLQGLNRNLLQAAGSWAEEQRKNERGTAEADATALSLRNQDVNDWGQAVAADPSLADRSPYYRQIFEERLARASVARQANSAFAEYFSSEISGSADPAAIQGFLSERLGGTLERYRNTPAAAAGAAEELRQQAQTLTRMHQQRAAGNLVAQNEDSIESRVNSLVDGFATRGGAGQTVSFRAGQDPGGLATSLQQVEGEARAQSHHHSMGQRYRGSRHHSGRTAGRRVEAGGNAGVQVFRCIRGLVRRRGGRPRHGVAKGRGLRPR
jgi:hypothetical protein